MTNPQTIAALDRLFSGVPVRACPSSARDEERRRRAEAMAAFAAKILRDSGFTRWPCEPRDDLALMARSRGRRMSAFERFEKSVRGVSLFDALETARETSNSI